MSNHEVGAPAPTARWATFFLGGEMFALRVADVQEVLMPQPLTPVPLAPPHIAGLINLRGQVVPVARLRRQFQLEDSPAPAPGRLLPAGGRLLPAGGRLLIVQIDHQPFGLLVDGVGDVLELPATQWRPAPDTLAATYRRLVFGVCLLPARLVMGLRTETLAEADHE